MDPGRACLNLARCRLSSTRAFCEMAGVPQEDVLFAQPCGRPFKPSWWLCLDHASRAVVVAVRGTFGTADVLSDALARQVHHNGHLLHEGILASAQWLLAKLRPRLRDLEQLHSGGYRLVMTGHSLGGAVAAILAWLLRTEEDPGSRFAAQAFVYGAPHAMDDQLARLMERFVVGIVHHNDVFPRFGRKSLEDLRDRVLEFTARPERRLANLEAVLADFSLPTRPEALRAALWDLASAETCSIGNRVRVHSGNFREAAEDVSEMPALQMTNPGWQLLLQRRSVRCRCLEVIPVLSKRLTRGLLITVRTPPSQYMQEIRPCSSMWTDHWPQGYQYVCEALAERLEARASSGSRPDISSVLDTVVDYFDRVAVN